MTVKKDGVTYVDDIGSSPNAVTLADGADVTEGLINDALVQGDVPGTISAKVRGLSYLVSFIQNYVANIYAAVANINSTVGEYGTPVIVDAVMAGGLTVNDSPSRLAPLPLGASGRSVLTENIRAENIPNGPAAISVGLATTTILAASGTRKSVRLVNTSNARISLGFGSAAILDSGITLFPGGVFNMDDFDFTQESIEGIASLAASNIGVQVYT